jgi:hypothetical protein
MEELINRIRYMLLAGLSAAEAISALIGEGISPEAAWIAARKAR